ncbi:glycosyltransferase family 4 protein [Lentibacillus sp. N15]|uniref:glycosyltransferase family 4 protein n=1 Tax=Lentibacillus songyuanensis TaxID=3136161 RepID=UPI0031BB8E26
MVLKILFCATVDYHFKAFHLPYMKWFKEQGWDVHVAAGGKLTLPYTDIKYSLPIQRSPFCVSNMEAYRQLRNIIEDNNYALIHCHTPIGGLLARLAAREARKCGSKVVYTVHGFHFCKGAPIINWLMYYPIEKSLAQITDCLITINQEDYARAVAKRFRAGRIEQVHGVGVDTEMFKPIDAHTKNKLRNVFGYQADDVLLFYAAEFNKNKNQQFLLYALALLKKEAPHVKLLLAGVGPLLETSKRLVAELGIEKMVDFLGFRNDIDRLLPMCDIAVASSKREGLPVNVMEAMACGLPVIAVTNRGHKELIDDRENGFLVETWDPEEFSNQLQTLAENKVMRRKFGRNGRKKIVATYSITNVLKEKTAIYRSLMIEQEETGWAVQ